MALWFLGRKRSSVRIRPPRSVPTPEGECTSRRSGDDPARLLGGTLRMHLYDPDRRGGYLYLNYRHLYPEHKALDRSQVRAFGWMDVYADALPWRRERTLDEIAATDHSSLLRD